MSFNITDDDVSGEPSQQYNLTLSEAPDNVTIFPYATTTINIIDNDRKFYCVYYIALVVYITLRISGGYCKNIIRFSQLLYHDFEM